MSTICDVHCGNCENRYQFRVVYSVNQNVHAKVKSTHETKVQRFSIYYLGRCSSSSRAVVQVSYQCSCSPYTVQGSIHCSDRYQKNSIHIRLYELDWILEITFITDLGYEILS